VIIYTAVDSLKIDRRCAETADISLDKSQLLLPGTSPMMLEAKNKAVCINQGSAHCSQCLQTRWLFGVASLSVVDLDASALHRKRLAKRPYMASMSAI
jgi:hypothetical protein